MLHHIWKEVHLKHFLSLRVFVSCVVLSYCLLLISWTYVFPGIPLEFKAEERSNTFVNEIGPDQLGKLHVDVIGRVTFRDFDRGSVTLGSIKNGAKYAVFSSSLHNDRALNYAFQLPLAALAWHRINFRSIIILIGDFNSLLVDSGLLLVLYEVLLLDAVVMVMPAPEENTVMISQTCRLFAASLFNHEGDPEWNTTYLVTSDADLWPLDPHIYDITDDTEILCLNYYCCNKITHQGKTYQKIPIGNIGMRVSTWKEVMTHDGLLPKNADDILKYFSNTLRGHFNSTGRKVASWGTDQRMVSIRIGEWVERNGLTRTSFVRRQPSDRVDRKRWQPETLTGMIDAHVPEWGFEAEVWPNIRILLNLMYDQQTVTKWDDYAEKFRMASSSKGSGHLDD